MRPENMGEMTTPEFLSYVRSLDIRLWADGDRLHYDAPSGALTPALRTKLIQRKGEILQFLREAESTARLTPPPIRPRTQDENPPLSFGQQRLWFLDQLEPGSSAYNIPLGIRLTGQLNTAALEQSLKEIVRRHEVLRTTFVSVDGQPDIRINPNPHIGLPVADLQTLPVAKQESETQRLIRKEVQRPFDLAQGPLLRGFLLRLKETEHIFLLVIHHLIFDGWSRGVFIRELSALYNAFTEGNPSPLPELPIQYADFALWQRRWLQGETLESQFTYWKQQLGGNLSVLRLPTDRLRPSVQTFRGRTLSFVLPAELTGELKRLSRQEGVTLFMVLLAAFKILLYRYTGREDVVIGTPVANRSWPELELLMGFFVSTLALRTDLSGNPSFRQLLNRVRKVALDAYSHQDMPFEQLVERLQPERNLSHSPLFQVMFALQNMPTETPKLQGVTLDFLKVDAETAMFDLSLEITENDGQLSGAWEYNTDLFDTATIARLTGHWQTLLEGIIANPEQQLSDLPLLTESERYQLLVGWNNTDADYHQDACLHDLFEAQARRIPRAVAVVFEGERLTYEELNRRANQLAHHLQTLGVKPEMPVGICMERSPELIVGLLGILKAGGAYVPLDPSYPKDRPAFMIEDTGTSVLVTQQRLLDRLPETDARVVCTDSEWEAIARESCETPVSRAIAGNLAYIIYTSGSTGKPKGVQIEHRGIINLIESAVSIFQFDEKDAWSVFHSYTFDTSVCEIWLPLLCGGRMVIVPDRVLCSPVDFYHLLCAEGVTVLNLPPSALRPFAEVWEETGKHKNTGLRLIICGGEALPGELAQRLSQWPVPLWNAYGPTEATVEVTCHRVETSSFARPIIPLGRPHANTQLYVLDTHLQPVPVGVPGELHIGGVGLARGYLNRPELTAEKFIPNPFSNPGSGNAGSETLSPNPAIRSSQRLYKTGDLVRYLSDGHLEFIGRMDHQVKIRGFRIEPGEIEALLNRHAVVQETVVTVQKGKHGDEELVAYLVPERNVAFSVKELRVYLNEKLPGHMIPSHFVVLDAFPLTSNGKIDRRALPDPEMARSEPTPAYVAPRDLVEMRLASIWSGILGTHPVGVTDNFFQLGGHSLLAVRLMAQIRKSFEVDLPLTTLFRGATIEHLSMVLRHQTPPLPWSSLVEIQSSGSRTPLFFVHPIGGNVFCYMALADHLGSDQPFYGLQALGLEKDHTPLTRIEDMAACYVRAIRRVQPESPYLLGGWSMGGVIAFEMARQLREQGHSVALLALVDSWPPDTDRPEVKKKGDFGLLADFMKSLQGHSAQKQEISHEYLQGLRPDEQLNYVLDQARSLALVPPNTPMSQILRLLKVYEANVQAVSTYAPKIYEGRVVLFKSSEGTDLFTSDLGWGKFSAREVEVCSVPGDHYTMLSMPNVRVLAERLEVFLGDFETYQRSRSCHRKPDRISLKGENLLNERERKCS